MLNTARHSILIETCPFRHMIFSTTKGDTMKLWISIIVLISAMMAQAQQNTQPYLVVYKEQDVRQLRSLQGSRLQKYLRVQTQQHESNLVKALPEVRGLGGNDNIKSLWILGSSIAQLNDQSAQKVSQLPFVRRLVSIAGTASLINPYRGDVNVENTTAFTYGLIKLGMPDLRTQYPQLNGQGVRVGIVDSGIDANHPDLKGKILYYKDFVKPGSQTPTDEIGHGTHVAGTIAGGNTSGRSIGVAPGVQMIIAKVFGGSGSSSREELLLALQWMIDPDGKPETEDGAHIVSNSWGYFGKFNNKDPQDEPFCAVLNRMRALNISPVFAAGNEGPGEGTLRIPGACPDSFTVGATDSSDRIARFSSKGPAKWKSQNTPKPDVTAPGVDVISARPRGGYQPMSGTSMAAPHVSGVMALMKQARPDLTQKDLETAVIKTSLDLGTKNYDMTFGHGRVEALKAIQSVIQSSIF